MSYDITPINLKAPTPKNSEEFDLKGFMLRNSRWRDSIMVLCSICPHLKKRDEKHLTDYSGRYLAGEKAEQTLICLRRVLLKRRKYSEFVITSEHTIPAEPWLWEDLEKIYEILCWSEGFIVR